MRRRSMLAHRKQEGEEKATPWSSLERCVLSYWLIHFAFGCKDDPLAKKDEADLGYK